MIKNKNKNIAVGMLGKNKIHAQIHIHVSAYYCSEMSLVELAIIFFLNNTIKFWNIHARWTVSIQFKLLSE